MEPNVTCANCGRTADAVWAGGLCSTCALTLALEKSDPSGDDPAPDANPTNLTVPIVPAEGLGTQIGRYTLLEKIGEGGCGVVYLAGQEVPVRRRVALKVIKPGMDSGEIIARFEAERQALALMDHPNIARVIDGGATDSGRPYFVMELVRGIRITDFCDQHRYTPAQRLELFIQVCQAVQHAHQKGIIHRDLKPSNILVTVGDDLPVPKVIDFGIAKATEQRLTDKTLVTHLSQFLGTPAYMSPEQAAMTRLDIDTRSDIYSLGVLLYELLTGKTPFDAKELVAVGLDEMRRTIRETEPPKPSTRLSTLHEAERNTKAASRGVEAPKLISVVRGDLDWIVMKCLEKERTRRYQTANALAADVRRHLQHEPVVARPPSAAYRINRFVQRNRIAVGAALLIFVALLAAVAISLHFALVTDQARRTADARRSEAEAARRAESEQRDAAVVNARESRERLVRLNIANGLSLLDEGDYFEALAWFTEALILDRNDPDRASVHQLRVDALRRQSPKLLQMWFHDGGVVAAQFSPDGNRIVTAGSGGARVWDVATGRPVTSVLHHDGAVEFARFSANGEYLLTAGVDNARLWNLATGKAEMTFEHDRLRDAIFSPDGGLVVTASEAGTVRVWDSATGREALPVLRHAFHVAYYQNPAHLMFSPDGRRLLTAGYNPEVKIWDVSTGNLLLTLPHSASVRHAEFSPDGRFIATANHGGTAHLWVAATGEPASPPLPHPGMVDHVTFSRNGQWMVSSGADRCVRLWNSTNGAFVGSLSEGGQESGLVLESQLNRGGTLLAARRLDGRVDLWSLQRSKAAHRTFRHGWWATGAQFHPDGRRLLIAYAEGSIRLWDLAPTGLLDEAWDDGQRTLLNGSATGDHVVTRDASNRVQVWGTGLWHTNLVTLSCSNIVWEARFSRDARRLLTAETGKGLDLKTWNIASGAMISTTIVPFDSPLPLPSALAANADCSEAAIAWGQNVEAWDLVEGERLWRSGKDAGPFTILRYSPGGERVVLTSGKRLHVLDAATGKEVYPALTSNLAICSATFSSDGRYVVTTDSDDSYANGEARLWEVESGRLALQLVHEDGVNCAAFSPGNQRLAVGGETREARVFELATGRPLTPKLRHKGYVTAVAFSPDGKWLATGSHDHTARIWDSVTGEALTPPLPHPSTVDRVSFLKTNEYLVTRSGGQLRLWHLRAVPVTLDDGVALGRLVAGHRIDATGTPELLDLDAQRTAWDHLNAICPEQFQFVPQEQPSEPTDATVRKAALLTIPRRDPGAGPDMIDLSRFYNAPLNLGWIPPLTSDRVTQNAVQTLRLGLQTFGTVPFDVRGVIQLAGQSLQKRGGDFPERVIGIRVGRMARRLHLLHATAWSADDDKVVARYVIHYADGKTEELPLRFNRDVGNWQPALGLPSLAGPASIVWSEPNSAGDPGAMRYLYLRTWTLQSPVEIETLDFVSTLTECAPFLVAVTVEP